MVVIDANSLKVVANYDLNGKGAGCAGLYGPAPETAPGERRRRCPMIPGCFAIWVVGK